MVLAAETAIVDDLRRLLPDDRVLWRDYDLMLYEYDGSIDKQRPAAVVFPLSTEEVSQVVRACHRAGRAVHGAGRGNGPVGRRDPGAGRRADQSGANDSDPRDRRRQSEGRRRAGVVNLRLGQAVAEFGLTYVPDPSSQKACTIGGNVGENSGGPHTLRYGVTTNHTLGLEVVLARRRGDSRSAAAAADAPGYDLVGLIVGSEGTLGIVTRIWVRLVPVAEAVKTILAVFPSMDTASAAVAGLIARRIVPAAIEMMDNLTIRAIESRSPSGYPVDAQGVVLDRGRRSAGGSRGAGHRRGRGVQRELAPSTCAWRRTTPSAPACGLAARARLRRSGDCRPTTTRSTASCRAPNCPRHWRASRRSRASRAFGSPTSFTPATATCTR